MTVRKAEKYDDDARIKAYENGGYARIQLFLRSVDNCVCVPRRGWCFQFRQQCLRPQYDTDADIDRNVPDVVSCR